jgi:crossover junction endodeoxyribonuclease RuvC
VGMLVVMGIDPGVANTGFGVVRLAGAQMSAIDGGVIDGSDDKTPERRLARIHATLDELVKWHEPAALALEDVYFGKNVRSAMSVGQVRGVAMLAAAERFIPCFGYTPQAVKMAVCGTGAAAKQQVQRMVATLLGLSQPPNSDHAADALAVAICHASHAPPQRSRGRFAATPAASIAARLPEAEAG